MQSSQHRPATNQAKRKAIGPPSTETFPLPTTTLSQSGRIRIVSVPDTQHSAAAGEAIAEMPRSALGSEITRDDLGIEMARPLVETVHRDLVCVPKVTALRTESMELGRAITVCVI